MTVSTIDWNPDLSAAPSDEAILLLFSDETVKAAWRYDKAAERFHPFAIWTEGVADYATDPDATDWPGDLIGCVDLFHRRLMNGEKAPHPVAWASMSGLTAPGTARAIIDAAAAKAERMEGGHA